MQILIRHDDNQKTTGLGDPNPIFQGLPGVDHMFQGVAGVDKIISTSRQTFHLLSIIIHRPAYPKSAPPEDEEISRYTGLTDPAYRLYQYRDRQNNGYETTHHKIDV